MTPFVQLQIVRARLEGVNGTLSFPDGKRGSEQLQVAVQELGVLAHALDAVQPVEATATAEIRSGFYLTLPDLDVLRHELAEISEASRSATIEPIGADERIRGHVAAILRLLTLS